MRVACPSCAAVYEVPAPLLIAGRKVRCSRCGEEWVPAPPEPPAADAAAMLPEAPEPAPGTVAMPPYAGAEARMTAMDRLIADPAPPPGRAGLRLAWIASLAALALLLAGLYLWRDDVARLWPPSRRLYAALGLLHPGAPPPRAPEGRDVRTGP